MPAAPELVEIRIHAFKSVRDARLTLGGLTVLVGRNGSGKSNVLDALDVLTRLARGGPLSDALDGGASGGVDGGPEGVAAPIRGGSRACAPLGSTSFSLGCSVHSAVGTVHLDVEVEVDPELRIRSEELRVESAGPAGPTTETAEAPVGFESRDRPVDAGLAIAELRTHGGPGDETPRDGVVTRAAGDLLDALRRVFELSPDPDAIRYYVAPADDPLRPDAGNLSAVLARAVERDGGAALLETLSSVTESQVVGLGVATDETGEVMFTQEERIGGHTRTVPACLMSDGTLHLLAVLAVIEDPRQPDRLVVLEEVESGLHPSQGAALVARIRSATHERGLRALVTTHSPAMLDALRGEDHEGIVVCVRDGDGWTRLHRLVDLPNYFSLVASGTLGGAATSDRLRPVEQRTPVTELIDRVFGGR